MFSASDERARAVRCVVSKFAGRRTFCSLTAWTNGGAHGSAYLREKVFERSRHLRGVRWIPKSA